MHTENHNRGIGKHLRDPLGRFRAAEVRHGDIENHHVRSGGGRLFDGLPSIRGLRDHREFWMAFQQQPKPPPYDVVIIR